MSGGVRNLELGMGWSICGRFCGEGLVNLGSVLWGGVGSFGVGFVGSVGSFGIGFVVRV